MERIGAFPFNQRFGTNRSFLLVVASMIALATALLVPFLLTGCPAFAFGSSSDPEQSVQSGLSAVPVSWNGMYVSTSPYVGSFLSIHDGIIHRSVGGFDEQLFPLAGTSASLYSYSFSDVSCSAWTGGRSIFRFTMNPDIGTITYRTDPDGTSTYVPWNSSDPVATPSFSLEPGVVAAGSVVRFASATYGSTICFTTDGTQPGASSRTGTFTTVDSTVLIRIIAVKDGMRASETVSGTFTVVP